jgi:hypothetical protein
MSLRDSTSTSPAEVMRLANDIDRSLPEVQQRNLETLESGGVVLLPRPSFELTAREREIIGDIRAILSVEPEIQNGKPTVVFDPARGRINKYHYQRVRGKNVRAKVRPAVRADLEAMMARFSRWAEAQIAELFPRYVGQLDRNRVTYRPTPRTATQPLHIDSSYGYPSQGRGMLRIFCNVDPAERPRIWQVGEPFEPFVNRFIPSVTMRPPGWVSAALARLGIVRGSKTPYDQMIAELRELGKGDAEYQRDAPRRIVEFPSGCAWIAITDLVLHGAMAGQHSLDQTFFLPSAAMRDPSRSSLKILERLTGRQLV